MLRNTLQLSGIFLIFSFLSSNPVSVTGQITDHRGFPIPFAIVEHPHSGKWSVSDENGFFHLLGDLRNSDELFISRIGYEPENFSLGGRTVVQILLNKHPVSIDPVLVEGKLTSPNVTSYTFFQQYGDKHSTHSHMDRIPGLQIRSYGSLAGNRSLSLNGGPGNHTKVLLDGVDLTSPQNGATDLSLIPLALVDQITTLPLPGVFFGSGAIDGILSMSSWPDETSVSLSSGSYGYRAADFGLEKSFGSWAYHIGAGKTGDIGNYPVKIGDNMVNRENNYFSQDWGKLQIRGIINKRISISAVTIMTDQHRGVAGSLDDLTPKTNKYDKLFLQSISLGYALSEGYMKLQISHRKSNEIYDSPEWFTYSKHHLLTDGAKFTLSTQSIPFIYFQSSSEWKKESINSTDAGIHKRNTISQAFRITWSPIQKLAVIPAIRLDDAKDLYSEVTYNLQIAVKGLKGSKFSTAIGTNYRHPNFNDLYFGSSGNTELRPEFSNFRKVKWEQIFDQNNFLSLTYIDRKSQDMIQWDDQEQKPLNLSKTRRQSITVFGKTLLKVLPFSLEGHFTLLNTRDEGDWKPLLYTPDRIGNVDFHFERRTIGWSLKVQYTGERRYTTTDYDENWNPVIITDQLMNGFICVSASMLYRPAFYENRFDITFVIDNLFEENIQAIPGYPEPGRNFKLSLGYTPQL
jgi:vitamin B12 transporter|tara:strand:+ start:570 stop:2627 length:2058 start_codon:yes stop_codon:yes gene_type:complete